MSLPDQTPKLPKWPFLLGDIVLVAAAWYFVNRDNGPLTVPMMAAASACVALAAILGALPFLADYARRQDVALDERQRGLEALSRTITTAAEQISIAANGLNELTDLTHKNLRQAEQLPHKLHEKIAEFNAQLDNAREDDREELEKELTELRTSETERLQAVSDKVHKAATELSRLETALQQQLQRRNEEIERAASAFTKAANDATQALSKEISTREKAALAEIDRALAHRIAQAQRSADSTVTTTAYQEKPDVSAPSTVASADTPVAAGSPSSEAADVASPPKRPRKARREELPPAETAASESTVASEPEPSAPPSPPEEPAQTPAPFVEPPPVPAETFVQIQPVAPASAEPFPVHPAAITQSSVAVEAPATERSVKKRPAKKAADELPHQPLELAGFEFSSDESADAQMEPSERVLSSDGATRLIVTAYIGIGNRLFIRGDGPGLNWENGVPLQFVSIGKWRWETSDAVAPIHFKLFKNDEVECASLGAQALEVGYQQEFSAKF